MGSFGPDNLTDRFERKIPMPAWSAASRTTEAIDLAPYLAKAGDLKRGLFLLKVQGYDPLAEAAAVRQPANPDPNAPAQAEPRRRRIAERRGRRPRRRHGPHIQRKNAASCW